MKRILCMIISLIMVLTSSISVAYAKPNKKDKADDMKYWQERLKQYYKEKNRNKADKKEYIKQIANFKKQYNIKGNIIFLNGEELETETPPVLKDGRIIVPLRAIVQALGAKVD